MFRPSSKSIKEESYALSLLLQVQSADRTRIGKQVYNLTTGAQHDLAGHQEEVFALAAANGLLLSGGKDMSIRVWQHDTASGTFQPSVSHPTSCSSSSSVQFSILSCQPCQTPLHYPVLDLLGMTSCIKASDDTAEATTGEAKERTCLNMM